MWDNAGAHECMHMTCRLCAFVLWRGPRILLHALPDVLPSVADEPEIDMILVYGLLVTIHSDDTKVAGRFVLVWRCTFYPWNAPRCVPISMHAGNFHARNRRDGEP